MKKRQNYFRQLMLLLFMLPVSYGIQAQNQKITLPQEPMTLLAAFEEIEKQTDLTVAYNESTINVNRNIRVDVVDKSFSEAMNAILKDTHTTFRLQGKQIIIVAAPEAVPEKKYSGTVIDDKGEAVIGAGIAVKGSKTGTVTDVDGRFSIQAAVGSTLLVSYIGFTSKEIKLESNTELQIVISEDPKMLDEVVVIGYGAVRKSDLTGSVASVKMNELNTSTPTLELALVGHTPGVEIKQTSGAPGSGTLIRVRGVNSVYGGVEPLYVIDGYPASKDVYINPSDVASIEVLKDAASAAIYGSRASGGVVLITTKRGKEGKAKVELSYQFSSSSLLKKIEMMNSEQLFELHKDGYNNAYFDFLRTGNIYNSDEERRQHSRTDDNTVRAANGAGNTMLLCPDYFNTDTNTDWQDELFSSAPTSRINFSVNGGKEDFKYMFSLGYLDQNGIIAPSEHNRITSRFNMDMQLNDRWSIGVNSNLSYVKDRSVRSDGLAFNDGLILNALGMPPQYAVRNADNSYVTDLAYQNTSVYTTFAGENPLALANEITQHYTRSRYAADANLKYRIFEGLSAKINAGMQVADQIFRYYRPASTIASSNYTQGDFTNLAKATNDRDFNTDMLFESTLNYERIFGKHGINTVAGYSMQRKDYDNIDVDASGFTSDRIQEVSGAGAITGNNDGTVATTDRAAWSLMSLFARAIYSYDERYTLSASFRSDGCSRFGSQNRWGYFPSVSGGWNVSNEKFWEKLKDIAILRLRASYGISGNNNISNYRHIPLISSGTYNFGSSTVTSYYPSGFTDLKLGWEKTQQANIGLDLSLFNGRLNLIANYYNSVTTDLLYQNTVSIITGSTSYWTNLSDGFVYNKGFDFQADVSLVATTDFRWNVSANISFNRNKVNGLKDEIIEKAQRSQITHITRNGLPIGSYYGMVSEGIITAADYENIKIDALHQGEEGYTLLGPPVADYAQVYIGDVKWRDVDKNGRITEDDRDIIGDNYPDFNYGISTSVSYKNLSLSAAFDGQYGNEVINFSRYYIANMEGGVNSMVVGLDRYRDEANPGNGVIYRANRSPKNLNTKFSTYFIEDASFFRCTNVTLAYKLPEIKAMQKLGLANARIHASIDNLFMLTKYSGYNPDVNYTSTQNITPGLDFGTYPLSRTWSMGINLTF